MVGFCCLASDVVTSPKPFERISQVMGVSVRPLRKNAMRISFLLVTLLILLPFRVSASDPSVLKVSLGSLAPGASMGTAAFWLDGVMRGVLPTEIQFTPASAVPVSVSGGDLGFSGVLKQTPGGFTVELGPNSHCTPYDAEWRTKRSGQKLEVVVDVKKVGNWNCSSYPATGAPDGKGKIKFETIPAGATLYYPKYYGAGFSAKPTPATLVVDFTTNHDISVVFKKAGYYDCSRVLGFSHTPAGFEVQVDGAAQGVTTSNTAAAPTVSCSLTPLTPGH